MRLSNVPHLAVAPFDYRFPYSMIIFIIVPHNGRSTKIPILRNTKWAILACINYKNGPKIPKQRLR